MQAAVLMFCERTGADAGTQADAGTEADAQRQWKALIPPQKGGGYSKGYREAARHNVDLLINPQPRWIKVGATE
jgi:hypothetical protein